MKRLYSILSATILFGTAIPAATAAVEVSVDFFHENLDAYGDWREVGDYGYCWQPRDVDRSWRPYSDGHWLYTDAGWTWDSEEPYSWAVYHYGRWTRVNEIGWVWVPGTEWGPAWVSWRRSPEYVGWAPLPPEARFEASVGFGGRVDVDFDIGPAYYSFVQVQNFGAPRLRTVIVEPRENITIINRTTNITRITYVNNVIYNGGPRYDDISRESAQPIRRLKLERRAEVGGDPRAQFRSKVEGDSFHVIAPAFDKKPATAPKKVAAKVEKTQVDHGWKDAGPPAEVAKVREKIKSEPATAAEPPSQLTTSKTGGAPVSPVSPIAPGGKPGKGNTRDGDRPAVATDPGAPEPGRPTRDATPAPPEKVTPRQPPKPGKRMPGEPAKPGSGPDQLVPPAGEDALPPGPPKKGAKNGEVPRRPEVQPNVTAPEVKPRPYNVEPPRKPVPSKGEPPQDRLQPGKGEAGPRPEPPDERKPDRPERPEHPGAPEPGPKARPDPRPQADRPQAGGQPQQPEHPKGKGKGPDKEKEKDDKKDGKRE